MARHFIKVLNYLEPHARSVVDVPDWSGRLFSDLTEGGDCLSVVQLTPNEYGPRIGLCGDHFFCEAGLDRDREDCLFISRIESADVRMPRQVPQKIHAEFRLLSGDEFASEDLDSVRPLFATSPITSGTAEPRTSSPFAQQSKANSQILSALSDATTPTLVPWRPASKAGEEEVDQVLEIMRGVWSRHRLDRFVELSPRWSMILNQGVIKPSFDACEEMLRSIDMRLLNDFATKSEGRQVLALVEDLAPLPLNPSMRASLWSTFLIGLGQVALRRELHEAAAALQAESASEAAFVWARSVLDALEQAAQSSGDTSLRDQVQSARGTADPLAKLGRWAGELRFSSLVDTKREPLTSTEDAAEPARTSDGERRPSLGEPTAGEREEAYPSVESWVLNARLNDRTDIDQLAEVLEDARDAVRDLSTLDDLRMLLSRLESLADHVEHVRARLPSREQVEQDRDEAVFAYKALYGTLGNDANELIGIGVSPAEIREVAELLANEELMRALPGWVWRDTGREPETEERTLLAIARTMLTPEVKLRVGAFAAAVGDFNLQDLAPVSQIPSVPANVDLELHVSATLRSIIEEIEAVESIPAEYAGLVGGAETPTVDILGLVDSLEDVRSNLSPSTFSSVIEHVAESELGQRAICVGDFTRAIKFFEDNVGSAEQVTIEQLKGVVLKQQVSPGQREVKKPKSVEFEIDHNWTTERGSRPTISIRSSDDLPYGWVEVPFVIFSRRPTDCAPVVDLLVKGHWQDAWPSDWPDFRPRELAIHRSDWRTVRSEDRKVNSATLDIPVRLTRSRSDSFECIITLRDPASGDPISDEKVLRWDALEPAHEEISLNWPEGLSKQYVEDHPIGPQKSARQIHQRIESGSPFAVAAPRRFGKSTLIEYLKDYYRSAGWVVPDALVCTSFFDGVRLDYEGMWSALSDRLQAINGASLSGGYSAGIPTGDAFGYQLKAAKRDGSIGILVLIDEAQLLFPAADGSAVGNLLKDRLERDWAAISSGELPIVFGLVGLPTLLDRAGANLVALLRPVEGREMDQGDLNRVVLDVTGGRLQTTREARGKIVDTASNLFMVKMLIENLIDLLNARGRRWASYEDVAQVELDLIDDLEKGEERGIGMWIRDALNDAETVNQWRPRRSFPVALAIAKAGRAEGARGDQEIQDRCGRILSGWCDDVGEGELERLSYGPVEIDEHIRALKDLHILDRMKFRSQLMEAWLVGECRNGYPLDSVEALIKGAHKTIEIPEGADLVDDGGQAKIYRFVNLAYRTVELKTAEDRRRFLESARTLDELARGEYKSEAGAQYIFDLRSIGFARDEEETAVQIYRWIEGQDLLEKVGLLSAEAVVDLGSKLGQAVQLLHSKGVLHRDIQPRNIVVSQNQKRPVLIDFGMAHLEAVDMKTVVGSVYAAPEVRVDQPNWTKAADVYSLASVLDKLWDKAGRRSPALSDAIERALSENPSSRPDAEELVQLLAAAASDLKIRERADETWNRLLDATAEDRKKPWFWSVLRGFQSNVEAIALGVTNDDLEQCADIADFINQLLEAYPLPRGETRTLSLAWAKDGNDYTGNDLATDEIRFLHKARVWISHGDKKLKKKGSLVKMVGEPVSENCRRMARDGAIQVAPHLKLESLPAIVDILLGE